MRVPKVIRKFFNLTDSQQDRVIRIVNDMANLNYQLSETKPTVYPRCHFEYFGATRAIIPDL